MRKFTKTTHITQCARWPWDVTSQLQSAAEDFGKTALCMRGSPRVFG
jgi:hypothetical protein